VQPSPFPTVVPVLKTNSFSVAEVFPGTLITAPRTRLKGAFFKTNSRSQSKFIHRSTFSNMAQRNL
jgi:hypothetical protein